MVTDEIPLDESELRQIALYAADCAQRALPIFEGNDPTDTRPQREVELAAGDAPEVGVEHLRRAVQHTPRSSSRSSRSLSYRASPWRLRRRAHPRPDTVLRRSDQQQKHLGPGR